MTKKARSLGLADHLEGPFDENDFVGVLLRYISVVPNLPGDKIQRGYDSVRAECGGITEAADRRRMFIFMEYWRTEWLLKHPHSELTLWDRSITTTSGLESLNANFNRAIATARPDFWTFLGKY